MTEWFSANEGTIMALIATAGIISLAAAKLIRDKRKGKPACGCSCGGCCANCPNAHKKTATNRP